MLGTASPSIRNTADGATGKKAPVRVRRKIMAIRIHPATGNPARLSSEKPQIPKGKVFEMPRPIE
jgi:hypothetical protein